MAPSPIPDNLFANNNQRSVHFVNHVMKLVVLLTILSLTFFTYSVMDNLENAIINTLGTECVATELTAPNTTQTYGVLVVQDWCGDGEYKIHGLWVDYVNKSMGYPQYCREVDYVPPGGNLRHNMTIVWNNCDTTGHNGLDAFWSHEWRKHGSCYNNNINEHDYFMLVMQVFSQFTQEYMREICSKQSGGSCILPLTNIIERVTYI